MTLDLLEIAVKPTVFAPFPIYHYPTDIQGTVLNSGDIISAITRTANPNSTNKATAADPAA
jgi:hypothetical protein